MAGLRVGQIALRQDLGIEALLVAEVLLLELRGVQLVGLRELEVRLDLEAVEGADGLGRERPAVDQEEHPPRDAGLHQPVDLVDQREGLARAGGHGDQQVALALGDGLLDRGVGVELVRPQPRVVVRHLLQAVEGAVEVAAQQLPERAWRVEAPSPAASGSARAATSWNQMTSPFVA